MIDPYENEVMVLINEEDANLLERLWMCNHGIFWESARCIERLYQEINRTCEWKLVPNQHWKTQCGMEKSFCSELHKYCATCGGRITGDDVENSRTRTHEQLHEFFNVKHKENYAQFCEWKHFEEDDILKGWQTECQDSFFPTTYSEYCTYCGRRVKEID